MSLSIILFLLLVLGWTLLPFLPAWGEYRRKEDTGALPVRRDSQVDVRYFAKGFREYFNTTFSALVDSCRRDGRNLEGVLPDGATYLIVPDAEQPVMLADEERGFCTRMILSASDLVMPSDCAHAADVYAAGRLTGGARSVYRAALAEGSLELAAGSASLRWLHAGGDFTAHEGCRLCGRSSSDGPMRLASGCRFERLHAPTITFGVDAGGREAAGLPPVVGTPLVAGDLSHVVDTSGGRWLVKGNCELKAGQVVECDLVVLGDVILREGARLHGSLKSRGTLVLERGVRVDGSVIGERGVVLGHDCTVKGPVVSEGVLTLRAGCRVGDRDALTTVSARDLRIEPGTVCHGTVWAHRQGDVLAPSEGVRIKGGPA